jgi:uncharacterized membrane protein YbhN (UPF0104 family)
MDVMRQPDSRAPDAQLGRGPSSRSPRRIVAIVAAAVLLASVGIHLIREREVLAGLPRLPLWLLLSALALQLGAQLFWNAAMLLPLRTHMDRIGFWELFMVRSGGSLAGLVLPVANLALRLAYLKRRGLGYAEFAWATALANVLALFAGGVLAVFALALLWFRSGLPPRSIVALASAVLALGVGGLLALRFAPRLAGREGVRRWAWIGGIARMKSGDPSVGPSLVFLFLRHICNLITFGLLFRTLSAPPADFMAGGLIYAITSPVRTLMVTPGNLGVSEWAVAAVGSALAVDVTHGLVVALVFRLLSVAAQGAGVLLGGVWMARGGRPSPDAASP